MSIKLISKRRKNEGHSLIEMVCALVIIIPAVLCLIDLYFLIMGYWWVSSTCTNTARCVAQGPPNALMVKAPQNRAKQVLESSLSDTNSTIHLDSYDVQEFITRLPDPITGGAVNGLVTINMDVSITPPFVLKLAFNDHKFIVHASHTCPYTYVQRATIKEDKP